MKQDARRGSAPEATLPRWAIFPEHAKPMKLIHIDYDINLNYWLVGGRAIGSEHFLRRRYCLRLPHSRIS